MKSQTNILNKRTNDTRASRMITESSERIIMKASRDDGVIRNGGRRGAAYAPACLMQAYKKMAQGQQAPTPLIQEMEVLGLKDMGDFDLLQNLEADRIADELKKMPRSHIVHLGGGHDHVFPLLKALTKWQDKVIHVINIDAHLDTRQDPINHSGTPFRQFAKEFPARARITQIGIQDFANVAANWQEMTMKVHRCDKIEQDTLGFTNFDHKYLDQLLDINPSERTVFSLDLDAISAAEMPAVSAINASGLPLGFVRSLLKRYLVHCGEIKIVGLYEFNPIYDTVSGTSARVSAGLIQLVLD